jgi:hypothetical protein
MAVEDGVVDAFSPGHPSPSQNRFFLDGLPGFLSEDVLRTFARL